MRWKEARLVAKSQEQNEEGNVRWGALRNRYQGTVGRLNHRREPRWEDLAVEGDYLVCRLGNDGLFARRPGIYDRAVWGVLTAGGAGAVGGLVARGRV